MMQDEFWKDSKRILTFLYKCSLPKLYDPDPKFYPHTLMLPVLKSGINSIDDEWHLRIWKSDSKLKNKLCLLEVIEEQMDDPIIIELYLHNSLCEFKSVSRIQLCTCQQFEPFTDVIATPGSVGASLYVSHCLLKQHENCYGDEFKLSIQISILNEELGNGYKNPIIQEDLKLLPTDQNNGFKFTIIVGNKRFDCTGWKWSYHSLSFRALFRKMLQNGDEYFEIKGILVDDFQVIWNNVELVFYTDFHDVYRHLAVADFFQMDFIKHLLASQIMHLVDRDNWHHMVNIADKFELPVLKKAALNVGYLDQSDFIRSKSTLYSDRYSSFINRKTQLVEQIERYFAHVEQSNSDPTETLSKTFQNIKFS